MASKHKINDLQKKSSYECCTLYPERTDMIERVELANAAVREVVTENDNESPRNEYVVEEDMRMQLCISNYVILRTMMNQLDWRDQRRCALVSKLWCDAVKSLQCNNLQSCNFLVISHWYLKENKYELRYELGVSYLPVQARPMFAIAFFTDSSIYNLYSCLNFSPELCDPPCDNKHTVIEAVHEIILSRSCLLGVQGLELMYMSHPNFYFTKRRPYNPRESAKGVSFRGIYLPKIPNVIYQTVHYRTKNTVQEDVYSIVDDICATHIIKGIVVFVNDDGLDDTDLEFLNYFMKTQPSIPFALGGYVSKLWFQTTGFEDDVTVIMGVFSVPKEMEEVPGGSCRFNIYSLIIGSPLKERAQIKKVIKTFAENITELQYSTTLTMSSISRKKKGYQVIKVRRNCTDEQALFCELFPRTSILGCYSDRQIGYSHPEKTTLNDGEKFMHINSSVFIYFTWGSQCIREKADHTKR